MQQTDTTTQTVKKITEKQWNAAVNHPLQSWAWGEFRKAMGIDVVRLNTWQLTFHRVPHTPWTIGYFPKGPKPTTKMIEELQTLGRTKHAIFIQLEPNVLNTSIPLPEANHPLFTKYTFVLDLKKSEEELLKAMHSKTRYNLRVAERHEVKVQEDNSPQAFEEYLRLTRETTARQGFYAHNETYHRSMWNILHASGIGHLFTATYQGEVLSAWIIFTWKDTVYYPYGSSSRNHREVMAPTLLLWNIALWAKKQGYTSFDLWGAMGPTPDIHDPWYGFHRFKQGFNPTFVEYAGSYDLIINPLLYRLYILANSLRWAVLKLKSR